jgi:hypothetical protein
MKIVAAAFVCLGLGSAGFAQSGVNFDFGSRAGVPVTKPLSQSETGLFNGVPCCGRSTDSVARTFIVGPALGVTFFDRVRVEFDALHRPLRGVAQTLTFSPPVTWLSTTRTSGRSGTFQSWRTIVSLLEPFVRTLVPVSCSLRRCRVPLKKPIFRATQGRSSLNSQIIIGFLLTALKLGWNGNMVTS